MPTYEYACTECEHAFEQVQSFSEDSLTVCDKCEGRLRKIFNAVGVVFKGSGFYRNDSRKDAQSESHSEAQSGSEPDSKPDSKPESKSDSKQEPRSDSKSEPTSGSRQGSKASDAAASSSEGPRSKTSKPKAEAGAA